MNLQSFWNKVRKETPPFHHVASLDLIHRRDETLTQPCSLFCNTWEMTAIHWCGYSWLKTHTQAPRSSCLSDGDILLLAICLRTLKAEGTPETAEYNVQKHHEEWYGLSLPATGVYNILWLHANDGNTSRNYIGQAGSLLIGRYRGYSRMWCFMNWVDLFHCPQESVGLLSKK